MNEKQKILVMTSHYLPGYKAGGPIRSVANLVDQIGDVMDFYVITSDRDMGNIRPYNDIKVDGWNKVGKAMVFYASPGGLSLWSQVRRISETPHDVLYLNGFFNYVFTIYPLLARFFGIIPKKPVVIAPRGEFAGSALALKSRKKRIYIALAKLLGLYRNLTWQASSEHEVADIRQIMGGTAQQIVIACNLPSLPNSIAGDNMLISNEKVLFLRVCFLSRISPMKNLDYALRILSEVTAQVKFDIYGVKEDEAYWNSCMEIIAKLPVNIKVTYYGLINHANVGQTLSSYDLFFFPTRGENFGHVIYEALSAGLPVLTSDRTPWRNLETQGVGWVYPLEEDRKFKSVIEAQAKLGSQARMVQKARSKDYANWFAKNNKSLGDNIAMFNNLLVKNKSDNIVK